MKRALSLLMAIATVLTSMVFVISFSASAADSNIIWSQNFNDLTSWDGDVLASAGITGTWYGGNSGSRPDSKFTNSEGDYAVAIESVSGGKSEFYTPYFDVTPGDIIRITVKYRVLEQGSTTNGVIFTLYNAGSMTIPGWGEYTNPTPVSDYYKVEDVYCTVPEGTTSFRFAPGAANGAKIAFDDIIVQKVDSIPSQLKVVWSKDFDDADDWNGNTPLGLSNSNVPFEKAVGQGINGTNAVKITGTTYSLASVSLTSGKKYLVTFKYKALTDTDFYVYQQVYGTYPAIGNGGVQEVNYPNTYKLKAGSGWQMYSFVLNANDTSKDCVANFGPYVVTSGAQVLVDDYVIYELGDSTAADATSTLMWDVNFRALGAPAGAGSHLHPRRRRRFLRQGTHA